MNDLAATYIGDGVYAKWNGFSIEIYTYDGVCLGESIYLEPSVLKSLNEFYQRMAHPKEEQSEV